MMEIKKLKDCWGGSSYFGYVDGEQYTDGYDTIEDLNDEYEQFKDATNDTK